MDPAQEPLPYFPTGYTREYFEKREMIRPRRGRKSKRRKIGGYLLYFGLLLGGQMVDTDLGDKIDVGSVENLKKIL